jgi:four helix bundle protein
MGKINSRLKAPSVQDPSSREAPGSKLRKSSEDTPSPTPVKYPEIKADVWELKESSSENGQERHPFDLEERTALFGEAVIRFCKKIPRSPENDRLIDQLVGCGTSVGANYCEANEGVSKKDFKYSVGRCVKEAKETKFFLRMVAASEPALADEARKLYREAKELHLIFASMYRK